MPCKAWSELLERYRTAVAAYNGAVASLSSIPSPQFNVLWHCAEVARTEVETARAELLHHERKHGCFASETGLHEEEPVLQPTEEWVLGDQGQGGG